MQPSHVTNHITQTAETHIHRESHDTGAKLTQAVSRYYVTVLHVTHHILRSK